MGGWVVECCEVLWVGVVGSYGWVEFGGWVL